MARDSQCVRNHKPSIKHRCSPLDRAFIEISDIDRDAYAPTSSKRSKNGINSELKTPEILSTKELISAASHIWDNATSQLSVFLTRSTSTYNGGDIQSGEILCYPTGERTCSTSISADDNNISYGAPSSKDSSFMIPANFKYLRAIQSISLLHYSSVKYSILWRLQPGRTDLSHEPWDGRGLGSLGVQNGLRNIYGWMNIVAFPKSKHCVISSEIENNKRSHYCDGNEINLPEDYSNSMDPTSSAKNGIIGNADCHTEISNNVDSPFYQESRPVSFMQASNATLHVKDDMGSLNNIDANTSAACMGSRTDNNLSLSADHSSASEQSSIRTEEVQYENTSQPVRVSEKISHSEIRVSLTEKTHYKIAKQEHAFAGAMAGIFVSLCLHPLDTVKTVVQSCGANQNSLHHIVKSIVSERGVSGLYRGISSNIASSAPISAIYTFTYESVKGTLLPLFPKEYQSLAHCMAGGCASVATSFIFTPSERIKQQMQVSSHYQNCWNAFIKVIEKGGLPSLYAGWGAVLCRNVPHSIIKFYTYESLKQLMFPADQSSIRRNTLLTLLCGGFAGSTAAFFTTPFDVVKTRLQTQVPGSVNQYHGVLDTLKYIGKSEGLKGLYRGLTPRLFMYMTQGALFFASYESFKRLFSLEVPPHAQKVPHTPKTEDNSTPSPSQEHGCIGCHTNEPPRHEKNKIKTEERKNCITQSNTSLL